MANKQTIFFIIFLTIVVGALIINAVYSLIQALVLALLPFKFFVMDATLTQFNYTNNTFDYNLTLNMTVSKAIYYEYIIANVLYQNVSFGSQTVELMFKKGFSKWNMDLKGQHVLALNTNQILEFNKEKISGVYHINVKLCLRSRLKNDQDKPLVHCDLQVPLKSSKEISQAHGFHATRCHLGYANDDNCS
ncbi:YLS9 protein [Spatholobus suberectus]|nr:YLS9 protein [Spatholobus suberectus]